MQELREGLQSSRRGADTHYQKFPPVLQAKLLKLRTWFRGPFTRRFDPRGLNFGGIRLRCQALGYLATQARRLSLLAASHNGSSFGFYGCAPFLRRSPALI